MAQSFASVLLHLIYSTKNREPLLTTEVEPELYAYQAAIFQKLGCPVVIINGTADHLHALFRLSRTVAISELVEEVKKRSPKWIKAKGKSFAGFQWQTGYGVFSLGESGLEAARIYISGQKEHHCRQPFQEEFRAFLAKYRIEYDERYVWD
jgi:REP element-mobilizing transposase RayT